MAKIRALCSAIVWGSGQLLNKQKIKALIFFLFQLALIGTELMTGTWSVMTGQVENHFRNYGYFTSGIWGLITLGEIPRTNSKVPVYDHSIMLMISGLIAIAFLVIFLIIWIFNIRDAYKTGKQVEAGEKVLTDKEYFKEVWENLFEYIMIAPGMFIIIFITVIPVMFSIATAFTNYNTNNIPPKNLVSWVGFQTFKDIMVFKSWSSTFIGVFTWTIIWALVGAISCYVVGLIQAVIINQKDVRFKKLWRSIYILPWAFPAFLSLMIFRVMLTTQGPINAVLMQNGLTSAPIPFLSDPTIAKITALVVNLWIGFPASMALISSVLTTISDDLYEASDIDGATGVQKFRYITFPLVYSATAPNLMLSITFSFNNFGAIYLLTGGGPANPDYQMAGSTDILITWIYKLTVDQRMYNYGAAISIFIFIFVASISAYNLSRSKMFKED